MLARRLKAKLYNSKNKNAQRWRTQIYTHSDLPCHGNLINQPKKSTQVIMRRPGG